MTNKNIIKIRKKLDNLDNLFLKLIRKRQLLVNEVLKNKNFKKDIVDKKRIKIIIKNIKKKSIKNKIDPKITNKIDRNDTTLLIMNIEILKIVIYYVEVIFFNKEFVFSSIRIIFLIKFIFSFLNFVGFFA